MESMPAAYRADQVGSFLRSDELKQARSAHAQGELPLEQLRAIEDREILRVLDLQRQVGIEVFTDGEYRRGGWSTDFAEAVDGFVPGTPPVVMTWHDSAATPRTDQPAGAAGTGTATPAGRIIGQRLRPRRRLTAHEAGFLKQHAPGPIKMTLPAPSNFWVISWKAGLTDKAYASRSEMLQDVVRIVRDEIQALIQDGVDYIQMDAPFYGVFIDEQHRATLRQVGVDPDLALKEVVAADNAAIEGLPRDGLTLALHICRGNSRSRWLYEGGYNPIAETLFGGLDVDRFLLEYDDPEREGGFEPLRYLGAGKMAVLGLVTSKEAGVEPIDALRRRLDEAAAYVPLERLALSPQCGFGSVASGNLLSEDDQWRKLERVVQTARKVWG
jgi:5-methyltetrahydropteroyltriglutamate--homocysteine methyltransferase